MEGVLKACTGVVSMATAFVLWPAIPAALALRSPADLEAANLKLQAAVEELESANARLRESERMTSRLVENLSHELRTPLTLMKSPADAILSGELGTPPAAWVGMLRSISNNADRLDGVVQNALELARIDAGQFDVVRQPVQVADLVLDATRDFAAAAERQQQRLTVTTFESPAAVQLDRYLFERVLLNLLTNALKFTPEGGGVAVNLAWSDGVLELAVADTGPGIEQDRIEWLFDRFQQGDASRTRRHTGAGLGLALAREVVGLMNGSITVSETPGGGATFTVALPADAAEVVALNRDHADLPSPRARTLTDPFAAPLAQAFTDHDTTPSDLDGSEEPPKARVLLAEDNADMASLMSTVLQEISTVEWVPDGAQALARLRADPPDLLLTDVMMPVLDGLALCRAVKSDPLTRPIPVVLMSARGGQEALLEGWAAGADEYLFKPFHLRELRTRIETLLSGSRARSRAIRQRARAEHAEAHNRELAVIAAALNHDVAAPLRIIGQSLRLVGPERSADANLAIVQAAQRRVELLQELTTALLAWLRAGTPNGPRGALTLDQAVQDARDLVDVPDGFTVEVFGGTTRLALHRSDLLQLVSNLMRNAIQHHHGVEGRVRVSADRSGGRERLEVADDGPGIPLERREDVLSLFHAGPRGGSGVGLALIARIAVRTGARLRLLESEWGGTRVSLSWPTDPDGGGLPPT